MGKLGVLDRWLRPRAAIVAVTVALSFGLNGCGEPDHFYAMAVDQVSEVLTGTVISDSALTMIGHSSQGHSEDGGVSWYIVEANGSSSMAIAAKLKPVDSGTQVSVELLPIPGVNQEVVERWIKQNPNLAHMYQAIGYEQVDAMLTHREFAISNLRQESAAAVGEMSNGIKGQYQVEAKAFDEAARMSDQSDQETVSSAYASEGAAPDETEN
jgi:hypothetical protein